MTTLKAASGRIPEGVPDLGHEEASNVLPHILRIAGQAREFGPGSLSTGEQLAAAFVLNRPAWIQAAGFTLAEAVERLGPTWLEAIPEAAKKLAE